MNSKFTIFELKENFHLAVKRIHVLSPGQTDNPKLKQVNTSTCIQTCEGWPNGFASQLASSCKSQKAVNFMHIKQQITCDQLVSTCAGSPNGKKTCIYLHPNLSPAKVNASPCKSSQVGGQMKRKLNTSPKLGSTCKSIWPGLYKPHPRSQGLFSPRWGGGGGGKGPGEGG